jgi:hypothetical protein
VEETGTDMAQLLGTVDGFCLTPSPVDQEATMTTDCRVLHGIGAGEGVRMPFRDELKWMG